MFDIDAVQASLFGSVPVDFDPGFASMERVQLDHEAWLDYAPTWLTGDEDLYQTLAERAEWTQPVVRMYDREVLTPRLMARIDASIHPVVPRMVEILSDRYQVRLDQVSVGWSATAMTPSPITGTGSHGSAHWPPWRRSRWAALVAS